MRESYRPRKTEKSGIQLQEFNPAPCDIYYYEVRHSYHLSHRPDSVMAEVTNHFPF